MPIAIDIFGYRYDDSVPAFLDAGSYWFHRASGRLLTKASVTKYMNSFTPHKTMGAKESGDAPDDWLLENTGLPVDYPDLPSTEIAPGAVAPTITGIPAAATGGQATVQIQTGGKGLSAAAVATITIKQGTAADVTFTVNIAKGEQGHGILVEIAKAPEWAANDLATVVAGATMTVTNNHATDQLTKLTVTLA